MSLLILKNRGFKNRLPLLKAGILVFMHLKKDNVIKENRSLLKYLDSYCLYEYENYILKMYYNALEYYFIAIN